MAFAIIEGGQPVEVLPGEVFTTTQFKVTTDQEAAWAMVAVGTLIERAYVHPANALQAWDADDRARYAVHTFAIPVAPDGKRLASYVLTLDGDSVVATGTFADPEVPDEVLRVQGRLQLLSEGLLTTIENAVAAADPPTKEYWASTAVFRRHNTILTGMWAALGRTPAQLDATFIAASQIAT